MASHEQRRREHEQRLREHEQDCKDHVQRSREIGRLAGLVGLTVDELSGNLVSVFPFRTMHHA